jgi:hypothetical protein
VREISPAVEGRQRGEGRWRGGQGPLAAAAAVEEQRRRKTNGRIHERKKKISLPVLFVLAQGLLLALGEPLRGAISRRDVVDLDWLVEWGEERRREARD